MTIFFRPLLTYLCASFIVLSATSIAADDHQQTLLVVGDSLSAAYGIPRNEGWVRLIEKKPELENISVINASISGETTRAGLQRLPAALAQHKPSIVILELGANDGLRGISLKEMRTNLEQMVALSLQSQARVLLLGIKIPPNYGPRYSDAFEQIFTQLAEHDEVSLVPFFIEGIVGKSELMQADGLHPTASAQPIIVDNIWPTLYQLLAPQLN